ncbi:MAG TPA: response regulator transcription factor [Actinomycetota bacterium]|nr:response regulator transcription factor [Actinomycetota bacterium]
MAIRVLIADDDEGVRETLARVMRGEDDLEVVGIASDADEAVDLAQLRTPDVALLDVRMPKGGGKRAANGIALVSPRTVVIAFSAHDDASSITDMFEGGVGEYVLKDGPVDSLLDTIRRQVRRPSASGTS